MYENNGKTQNTSKNIDLTLINEKLMDCPDIIRKKVYIENQYEGFFLYIENLINQDLIQRDFIRPVVAMSFEQLSNKMNIHNIPCMETTILYNSKSVIENIMSGKSVFICTSLPFAISCSFTNIDKRSIEEPVTEKNVRGPHEGFVEPLQTNLSILRRKIKNDKLKFKNVILGAQTKQNVVISYIEDLANISIVNKLFDKISNIHIDGLSAIGYVEQCIVSHPDLRTVVLNIIKLNVNNL